MKNLRKKLGALGLVAALSIGSILPVHAGVMSSFPMQSEGSYSKSYTRGIQVMLLHYNTTTRAQINNAGGADGVYGSGTANAVKSFQTAKGIGVDGACGVNTWTSFRNSLIYTSLSGSYRMYRGSLDTVKQMKQYNSATGSWYCYYGGTWYYVG